MANQGSNEPARLERPFRLFAVEQRVLASHEEYLDARPRDEAGALAAARLDAGEEAERLVAAAYDHVLDSLLSLSRRAA